MFKSWLRTGGKITWVAVVALGVGGSADAGTVHVYANDPVTGDIYPGTDPILADSGWRYANTTAAGKVGVSGDLARDGNGSIYFSGANNNSKADISYSPGGVLGLLSELTSLSFDWIRTGGTARANLAPAIRVKVTVGDGKFAKTGYLVWEPVYNGFSTIPLDEWTTSDAIGGAFWATKPLAGNSGPDTFKDLDYWMGSLGADAKVVGFEVGIGSGWGGSFTGAVDNIGFGFNGQSTIYNFEVSPTAAVPEPGSIAMGLIAGGVGLAAAAWRRRRVG